MRRVLRYLSSLLWPRALQCLNCQRVTEGGLLCPECEEELERRRLPVCDGDVHSVWPYDGCARQLVLGLKDGCMADCAKVLARGMAAYIKDVALEEDTVLTWVTMPESRRRVRGIDHGRLLCEELGALTSLPARQLLTRRGDGHTQRGLSHEARRRNLLGAFTCEGPVHGTVLLIDDVLTTGSTGEACTAALREAGAQRVIFMTALRVIRDKKD